MEIALDGQNEEQFAISLKIIYMDYLKNSITQEQTLIIEEQWVTNLNNLRWFANVYKDINTKWTA